MDAGSNRIARNQPTTQYISFLLVSLFTGASCLIFELVWSRYLQLIFGVSVYAVATVLACFMLGLALGAWHLGGLFDRTANPKRFLIIVLLAIAAYIALSPLLYHALVHVAASMIHGSAPQGLAAHLHRALLSLSALIVPTYLMGGTFPALVKFATQKPDRISRNIATIYAINTLGGALGAFLTGFFLIRFIGLTNSLLVAAAMEIVAAILVSKTDPITHHDEIKSKSADQPQQQIGLLLAIIFITGFTSLAYEVYWTRLLTLFFKDSIYDLAIVLSAFLCGMVIGGFFAALIAGKRNAMIAFLAAIQVSIGLASLLGLVLISYFPYWINYLQTNTVLVTRYGEGSFWLAGNAIRFGYAFLLMIVPTCLFGAAFPLVCRLCAGSLTTLGRRLGAISGLETLGAALGSILAGFMFIPIIGFQYSIVLTAALNVLAGVVLIRGWLIRICIMLIAGLMVAILPTWDRLRMSTSFLDQSQPLEQVLSIKFYREDAHGLTSVAELVPRDQKFLITNRVFSQNTSDMLGLEDHRRLGQIPILLHPDPKNVLVVGLGAGITLRGVNECTPQSIDCIEISPGVIEAARYFSAENNKVLDDPKVHLIVDDARNYVSTATRQYDAIILDIFHPMSGGSSTIFSREYYQHCRQRLAGGGLICQWLPIHQLSMDDIKTIVATFRSVFPHTSLWFGMIGQSSPAIGLIGTDSPISIDVEKLALRLRDPSLAPQLREVNLQNAPLLLSHFIMAEDSVSKFSAKADIDTDDRPVIEFTAPKLPVQSYRQGVQNLLELSRNMEEIGSHLASSASLTKEELARYRMAKQAIVDGYRLAADDNTEGQFKLLSDALVKDRENEDLIYRIRQLEPGR